MPAHCTYTFVYNCSVQCEALKYSIVFYYFTMIYLFNQKHYI